jgi:hypothetical protein
MKPPTNRTHQLIESKLYQSATTDKAFHLTGSSVQRMRGLSSDKTNRLIVIWAKLPQSGIGFKGHCHVLLSQNEKVNLEAC